MLIMRWLSMDGRLNQKRYLYTAAAALILIIVLVVWLLHYHNKTKQPAQLSNSGLSNAAVAASDTNAAQKAVDSQDYTTAVNYYIEAINSAEADGNLNQAQKLAEDAINNIPDNQVPWIIYDDLVGIAKTKGNKSLEISSLKKAIVKSQQPNSGAPTGIVAVYNKMLKQLGAG